MFNEVLDVNLRFIDFFRRSHAFFLGAWKVFSQWRAVFAKNFFSVEVYNFKVFYIKEVLPVHQIQNFSYQLLRCPNKSDSFGHEFGRIDSEFFKILYSLAFLSPVNINEKSLNILGDIFQFLVDNISGSFFLWQERELSGWICDFICYDFQLLFLNGISPIEKGFDCIRFNVSKWIKSLLFLSRTISRLIIFIVVKFGFSFAFREGFLLNYMLEKLKKENEKDFTSEISEPNQLN